MAVRIDLDNDAKPDYPRLKKLIDGETIILFLGEKRGFVIKAGPAHKLGEYTTAWMEEGFEDYSGSVTISNI
jgi:hypothetical protein